MKSKNYKDYYDILGINKNASQEEIKKAYKKLAKKVHPDLNKKDSKATEKFILLKQAYETLLDPVKRKQYDRLEEEEEEIEENEEEDMDEEEAEMKEEEEEEEEEEIEEEKAKVIIKELSEKKCYFCHRTYQDFIKDFKLTNFLNRFNFYKTKIIEQFNGESVQRLNDFLSYLQNLITLSNELPNDLSLEDIVHDITSLKKIYPGISKLYEFYKYSDSSKSLKVVKKEIKNLIKIATEKLDSIAKENENIKKINDQEGGIEENEEESDIFENLKNMIETIMDIKRFEQKSDFFYTKLFKYNEKKASELVGYERIIEELKNISLFKFSKFELFPSPFIKLKLKINICPVCSFFTNVDNEDDID